MAPEARRSALLDPVDVMRGEAQGFHIYCTLLRCATTVQLNIQICRLLGYLSRTKIASFAHHSVPKMCGADTFLAILAVFFPPIAGKC
jgi:hypothetical protein